MKDYYEALGIAAHATAAEIKKAYRQLAKQYHPDEVKDDEAKIRRMYEIQEAYQCLGDEKKRKEYDKQRSGIHAGFNPGGERPQGGQEKESNGQPAPDMSQFERFFGFKPGKGMETYRDRKRETEKPEGPVKPEEMFAAFFGRTNHKGGGR